MNKSWRLLMLVASMLALVLAMLPGSIALAQDPTELDSAPVDEPVDIPPGAVTQAVGTVANGDFELGNLSGWGLANSNNLGDSWFAYTGTHPPLTPFFTISAPPQGHYAAVTDQQYQSYQILYQDITLPATGSYNLSFILYYSLFGPDFITPSSLLINVPNQQYRVDIVKPSAPITSVAPGDVLMNLFQTQVGDPTVKAPTPFNFNLGAFAGQTVRLRFSGVQTHWHMKVSVDDVALTLINQPPTADAGGPYLVAVGEQVTFDGSGSSDPDNDPLTETWSADGGTVSGNTYTAGAVPGIYDVQLIVNDGQVDSQPDATIVVVYDPDGGFVTGGGWIDSPAGAYLPQNLPFYDGSYYELVSAPGLTWYQANDAANATALVGCAYPHLATVTSQAEWDFLISAGFATPLYFLGGYQEAGSTEPAGGWQWVTGEPWDYTAWAGGEPNDLGGEDHLQTWYSNGWNDIKYDNVYYVDGYIVEYDDCLSGKANFGFVSKYKKGADTPTGNTEFQFHAAGLNFHSSSYDWLVVTGSDFAKFKGVGTINGEGEYKFMLWAGDGTGTDGADTFRIRIWTEDEFGVETDVYDNGMDQDIGGGSIVVHTKK
jgi:hypothetical protein